MDLKNGDNGIRTRGLCVANAALSQLSYVPIDLIIARLGKIQVKFEFFYIFFFFSGHTGVREYKAVRTDGGRETDMDRYEEEKQARKKSNEMFNSITEKVKPENQNQTHNSRREGMGPNTKENHVNI